MDVRGNGAPAAHRPRIMIVDDSQAHLDILSLLIEREGLPCDVVGMNSGQQALDYLDGHTVDLILLDLVMPEMDGFQTLRMIKGRPTGADVPVIMMSVSQDTEDVMRALRMGATDFIGKPVITSLLVARLRAILDTRALQMELRRNNRMLETANRLKDDLISICSHDLRAPLAAIELICQFLRESFAERPSGVQEQLINRILNQSGLARRLVENLLDLNRLEEGRLFANPALFLVGNLMRACAEEQSPVLHTRSVALQLQAPDEDVVCFGDREMIAQVIRNLLGNAFRFARSQVILSARIVDGGERSSARLLLSVGDDGPGIPPGAEERIFEKHNRVDDRQVGNGLGLFISRSMVELHGGTIAVESHPGRGTTFTATVPMVFRQRDLPDLSAYCDLRVALVTPSKTVATALDRLLLESGLLNVEAVGCDWLTTTDGLATELAIVDLDSGAVNGFVLAKAMAGEGLARHWVLLGQPERLSALEGVPAARVSRLETPLNPAQLLGLIEAVAHAAEPRAPALLRGS
jgi:signal transduction histidine kinase